MNKRIAVLQHLAVEHPGVFRNFLNTDAIEWEVFELDDCAQLPALNNFDALWVMGGPMDIWEESKYPWRQCEQEFIRSAIVELNMPFLGVCLGHQIIGQVFGSKIVQAKKLMHGKTSKIKSRQIGILKNLPKTFEATRYHSLIIDKKTLSENLEITAETDDGLIMGVQHKKYNIHGVQFHPESIKTKLGIKILKNFVNY